MGRKKKNRDFHVKINTQIIDSLKSDFTKNEFILFYIGAIRAGDVESLFALQDIFPTKIFSKKNSNTDIKVKIRDFVDVAGFAETIRSLELFKINDVAYSIKSLIESKNILNEQDFIEAKNKVPEDLFNFQISQNHAQKPEISSQEETLFRGAGELARFLFVEENPAPDDMRKALSKLFIFVCSDKGQNQNIWTKNCANLLLFSLNRAIRSDESISIDRYMLKYLKPKIENDGEINIDVLHKVFLIYFEIYNSLLERLDYRNAFKMAKDAKDLSEIYIDKISSDYKQNIHLNWQDISKLCGHSVYESRDGINYNLYSLNSVVNSREKIDFVQQINEVLSTIANPLDQNIAKLMIIIVNSRNIAGDTQKRMILKIKDELELYLDYADTDQVLKVTYINLLTSMFFDNNLEKTQEIFDELLQNNQVNLHEIVNMFSDLCSIRDFYECEPERSELFVKMYQMLWAYHHEVINTNSPYFKLCEALLQPCQEDDFSDFLYSLNDIRNYEHSGDLIKNKIHKIYVDLVCSLIGKKKFTDIRQYVNDEELQIFSEEKTQILLEFIAKLENESELHYEETNEFSVLDFSGERNDEEIIYQLITEETHQDL